MNTASLLVVRSNSNYYYTNTCCRPLVVIKNLKYSLLVWNKINGQKLHCMDCMCNFYIEF
jgi:hypothetical protein